ncbi:hypothetical protein GCM10011609_48610 [Lentzea pudingi]|uniref:DUF4405 domain-containing protein n=1 Tax=Lentzea pudingi TaxID=1789439 RepID=A0ABQ2I8N8_9PSEU|nr:hypothetical protein [Lentzea pudingi]GGN03770.1 hypothetical protein GCM10011609_48610 [Lentzea pudingi]
MAPVSRRGGGGGCAIAFFALFLAMPAAIVLAAPAVAARIVLDGVPEHAVHLHEWLWGSLAAVPLAMSLTRFALHRNGRLRRSPPLRRWSGLLVHGLVLLTAVNTYVFLGKRPSLPGEPVVDDSTSLFGSAATAAVLVLVVMRLWDRRARRVTVEEVRTAAAEADRALERVRAENARVRRQAERVRARLVKLRARNTADGEVKFHALRLFHRESYQCADTAHLNYESTQASLHTMSFLARRARAAPSRLMVSGQARAGMRAAAAHLERSRGELRAQVDHGLEQVRTLNANTYELKHEIRDSCGTEGRQWFADLEARVEQARAERGERSYH